eukprot:COSAG01_NODE_2508_length_7550_cov_21.936116_1_plen_2369_part_01
MRNLQSRAYLQHVLLVAVVRAQPASRDDGSSGMWLLVPQSAPVSPIRTHAHHSRVCFVPNTDAQATLNTPQCMFDFHATPGKQLRTGSFAVPADRTYDGKICCHSLPPPQNAITNATVRLIDDGDEQHPMATNAFKYYTLCPREFSGNNTFMCEKLTRVVVAARTWSFCNDEVVVSGFNLNHVPDMTLQLRIPSLASSQYYVKEQTSNNTHARFKIGSRHKVTHGTLRHDFISIRSNNLTEDMFPVKSTKPVACTNDDKTSFCMQLNVQILIQAIVCLVCLALVVLGSWCRRHCCRQESNTSTEMELEMERLVPEQNNENVADAQGGDYSQVSQRTLKRRTPRRRQQTPQRISKAKLARVSSKDVQNNSEEGKSGPRCQSSTGSQRPKTPPRRETLPNLARVSSESLQNAEEGQFSPPCASSTKSDPEPASAAAPALASAAADQEKPGDAQGKGSQRPKTPPRRETLPNLARVSSESLQNAEEGQSSPPCASSTKSDPEPASAAAPALASAAADQEKPGDAQGKLGQCSTSTLMHIALLLLGIVSSILIWIIPDCKISPQPDSSSVVNTYVATGDAGMMNTAISFNETLFSVAFLVGGSKARLVEQYIAEALQVDPSDLQVNNLLGNISHIKVNTMHPRLILNRWTNNANRAHLNNFRTMYMGFWPKGSASPMQSSQVSTYEFLSDVQLCDGRMMNESNCTSTHSYGNVTVTTLATDNDTVTAERRIMLNATICPDVKCDRTENSSTKLVKWYIRQLSNGTITQVCGNARHVILLDLLRFDAARQQQLIEIHIPKQECSLPPCSMTINTSWIYEPRRPGINKSALTTMHNNRSVAASLSAKKHFPATHVSLFETNYLTKTTIEFEAEALTLFQQGKCFDTSSDQLFIRSNSSLYRSVDKENVTLTESRERLTEIINWTRQAISTHIANASKHATVTSDHTKHLDHGFAPPPRPLFSDSIHWRNQTSPVSPAAGRRRAQDETDSVTGTLLLMQLPVNEILSMVGDLFALLAKENLMYPQTDDNEFYWGFVGPPPRPFDAVIDGDTLSIKLDATLFLNYEHEYELCFLKICTDTFSYARGHVDFGITFSLKFDIDAATGLPKIVEVDFNLHKPFQLGPDLKIKIDPKFKIVGFLGAIVLVLLAAVAVFFIGAFVTVAGSALGAIGSLIGPGTVGAALGAAGTAVTGLGVGTIGVSGIIAAAAPALGVTAGVLTAGAITLLEVGLEQGVGLLNDVALGAYGALQIQSRSFALPASVAQGINEMVAFPMVEAQTSFEALGMGQIVATMLESSNPGPLRLGFGLDSDKYTAAQVNNAFTEPIQENSIDRRFGLIVHQDLVNHALSTIWSRNGTDVPCIRRECSDSVSLCGCKLGYGAKFQAFEPRVTFSKGRGSILELGFGLQLAGRNSRSISFELHTGITSLAIASNSLKMILSNPRLTIHVQDQDPISILDVDLESLSVRFGGGAQLQISSVQEHIQKVLNMTQPFLRRIMTGCGINLIPLPTSLIVSMRQIDVKFYDGAVAIWPVLHDATWGLSACSSSLSDSSRSGFACTSGTVMCAILYYDNSAGQLSDTKCCSVGHVLARGAVSAHSTPNCGTMSINTGHDADVPRSVSRNCMFTSINSGSSTRRPVNMILPGECPDDSVAVDIRSVQGGFVTARCCELTNAYVDYDNCDMHPTSTGGSANPMPTWRSECAPGSVIVGFGGVAGSILLLKCCPIREAINNCPSEGGVVCSGRGSCVSRADGDGIGYCVCHKHASGKACEHTCIVDERGQICSGHGSCKPYGCDCDTGYVPSMVTTADVCMPVCEFPCHHGTCALPGYCACDKGFTGKFCNTPERCQDMGYVCWMYQLDDGYCDMPCWLSKCGDPDCADSDAQCPCTDEMLTANPCHPWCRIPACKSSCVDPCSKLCKKLNRGDGTCDPGCNTDSCNFDDGDCVGDNDKLTPSNLVPFDADYINSDISLIDVLDFAIAAYDPGGGLMDPYTKSPLISLDLYDYRQHQLPYKITGCAQQTKWLLGAQFTGTIFQEMGFTLDSHVIVYVNSAKRLLLVAFRGTDDLPVWALNVVGALHPSNCTLTGLNSCGQVHKGFQLLITALAKQLKDHIFTHQQNLTTCGSGCNLIVTGHSLGGALAQMFAMWLADQHAELANNMKVRVFGSPQWCKDQNCADVYSSLAPDTLMFATVCETIPDIITALPPGYVVATTNVSHIAVPGNVKDVVCHDKYTRYRAAVLATSEITPCDPGNCQKQQWRPAGSLHCQDCANDCPVGWYKANCGNDVGGQCYRCPTWAPSQIFHTAGSCAWTCADGYTKTNKTCSKCTVGQYSGSQTNSCIACPAGQTDEDANAATPCTACATGQHGAGAATPCNDCPSGKAD